MCKHTHTHTHARTHARTHAHTHTHTHIIISAGVDLVRYSVKTDSLTDARRRTLHLVGDSFIKATRLARCDALSYTTAVCIPETGRLSAKSTYSSTRVLHFAATTFTYSMMSNTRGNHRLSRERNAWMLIRKRKTFTYLSTISLMCILMYFNNCPNLIEMSPQLLLT